MRVYLGSASARTCTRQLPGDVERERSAVSGEKDVIAHQAFERLAIDVRYGRPLKILPR
jgi:hypothetical protein